MKKFFFAALLAAQMSFASDVKSKLYNVGPASVDTRAVSAKFGIFAYVAPLLGEMMQLPQGTAEEKVAWKNRVCLRVGALLVATLNSVATYEINAIDLAQKERGHEAARYAFGATAYCGVPADELGSPKYIKIVANEESVDDLPKISNEEDLNLALKKIVENSK